MARREVMSKAKKSQNDEFYTQYVDIQKELNAYLEYNPDVFRNKIILLPCDDPEWSNFTKFFAQNFERFGIKKLISTSYAHERKHIEEPYQLTLFESESPKFDKSKTKTHGKIFTLDSDTNKSGRIDINDLKWDYLKGDGDFRSDEVKKLRNEADIIITNPPFSLFREFLAWIMEAKKQFLIIGSINCITYKEVFPLIKDNTVWLGNGMGRWISGFIVPKGYELYGSEAKIDKEGNRIVATNSCLWLTNLEHGKRHQPLQLMTYKDNLKYSKHKDIKENGYPEYDNYNAIDVSFTDSIPSDYKGIMGVPVTFLDKYNPDQFRIVGLGNGAELFGPSKIYENPVMHKNGKTSNGNAINRVLVYRTTEDSKVYYTADNVDYPLFAPYARILIEFKEENDENVA
ncbi:MAG: DNA methyltransferase [Tenericutes bacterium]|jgi:hypothetical protein|nr:DNA methyltransferase [Mycoplasmatota bacterium]